MLIAVSCLSPVNTHILRPACASLSMHSGTWNAKNISLKHQNPQGFQYLQLFIYLFKNLKFYLMQKKNLSTITNFSKRFNVANFLCNWVIKPYLHNSKILAYFKNKMSFQKNQPTRKLLFFPNFLGD
jgi:hypothetical protein